MQIIIAILMLSSVESNLDLDSVEQYKTVKKVTQVVRLVNGIK